MDLDKLLQEPLVLDYQSQILRTSQEALWEKYKELNTNAIPNSILFVGDSITEFFPVHELIHADCPIYNRGVRGLTSLQLLNHLHQQIIDLKPRAIFLLIGINDLKSRKPEEIFETLTTIVKQIKSELPHSQIYLLSVVPMNESSQFSRILTLRNNQSILKLNALLKNIDKVEWVDLHEQFCDESGQLALDYTVDGIHLSVKAYRVLAEKFQNLIDTIIF